MVDIDIPMAVNLPSSNRSVEAELQRYYPELFQVNQNTTELDTDTSATLEPDGADNASPPANLPELAVNSDDVIASELGLELELEADTALSEQQVDDLEPPQLFSPEPEVSYKVKEIVRIAAQRRMRSGEFHYIDHPRVGILAIIQPVEKPELDLEADMTDPSDIVPTGDIN